MDPVRDLGVLFRAPRQPGNAAVSGGIFRPRSFLRIASNRVRRRLNCGFDSITIRVPLESGRGVGTLGPAGPLASAAVCDFEALPVDIDPPLGYIERLSLTATHSYLTIEFEIIRCARRTR